MADEGPRQVAPALGFPARLGAALAAPRAALAASNRPEQGGTSVTDVAALLGLTVLALHTAEVVTGVWIAATGDVAGGVGSIVSAASRGVSRELALLLLLAGGIWLAAGARRSLGRDLDLACVALMPLLAVKTAAALGFAVAGAHPGREVTDALGIAGYGWAIAVAALGVRQARSRPAEGESLPAPASRPRWRFIGWGALALWASLLALHAAEIARAPERVRPVVSGDAAPGFELPVIGDDGDLGPERAALADLSGRVVVLEFWATWCGPCRASLPVLQRVREAYAGQPVEVVAVNTEGPEAAEAAAGMLRELGFEGLAVSDSGRVANRYRVTTIPHVAVIGPDGAVREIHRGFPGEQAYERRLRAAIDGLLARGRGSRDTMAPGSGDAVPSRR